MNNDTKILIRAIGQVCNLRVVDEKTKLKSFNLQKGGGLVTTLVKHVYQNDLEIAGAGVAFEGNGAIECIVKDPADTVLEGARVIFTCSEPEAEKIRKGEVSVKGIAIAF